MLNNAAISRSVSPLGKLAVTATRHLYNVPKLECPVALCKVPITPPGLSALKKLRDLSDDTLYASAKGLFDTVSRINTAAFKSKGVLSEQYELTEPESVGLALSVLQAGNKLGMSHDLNCRPVASLVYNLLSPLQVDPELLARFENYAQQLIKDVVSKGDILEKRGSWQNRPPDQRRAAVEQAFEKSLSLARSHKLAAPPVHTVALSWSAHVSRFSAEFGIDGTPRDRPDDGSGSGRVYLPKPLIYSDAESFSAAGKRTMEWRNLDAALIFPLISHELFHSSQHGDLDNQSGAGRPSIPQWTRAVKIALSLGAQSTMSNLYCPVVSDQGRVLVHLPHEKEAWALTFIVIRAMINSRDIPKQYKSPLVNYMRNNFDVFATATGLASAPKPTQSNGRLWYQGTDLHIRASQFNAFQQEMAIDEFLAGRTVLQKADVEK